MSGPNSQHPNLTKMTKAFTDELAAQNAPPLYTLTPEAARQVLIEAQSGPVDEPEVQTRDLDLPVGPQGHTSVRLVGRDLGAPAPLMLYLHGGGWVMGNKATHDRLVRRLAYETGVTAAFVDYVPSPDSQYPQPLEQAYAVLEYLVKNAGQFHLEAGRAIVVGDSVGGNMALALALMAKERQGPEIGLEVLFYPVTDAGFDTDSYQAFSEGPWLTLRAMKWFWDAYLPDKDRRREITASPLQAKPEELKGLPPILILTAENDVLRDEGEAMARKLDEAGVKASSVRFNGTIHDFVMLNALAETGPAKKALRLAVSVINEYIGSRKKA